MENTHNSELDHRVGQWPIDIPQAAPRASDETARAEPELPGVNGVAPTASDETAHAKAELPGVNGAGLPLGNETVRVEAKRPRVNGAAPTASDETACAEVERPGVNGAGPLLGLPRELLMAILSRCDDWSSLSKLRPVSKAMRDAVDSARSSYTWGVGPRASASAPLLGADIGRSPEDIFTRACHSLGRALARYPNLVKLELDFSWSAGTLQRPLDVIIQSQHSSLTLLSLISHGNNETGRTLSLRGLEGLRSLHSLSFSGFAEETGWVAALQELTCVRVLQVHRTLPRELPVLPRLTHLYIDGSQPLHVDDQKTCRLRLAPRLVVLSVISACLVSPDPLPATLEEVVLKAVSTTPDLASLQFQRSMPAALPRLTKLKLDDVGAEVVAGLLAASPGLTSVSLIRVKALRTLPQLSALPELKSLELCSLCDLEKLELQHLRSLEHLVVMQTPALRSVTIGPHNSRLERVELAWLGNRAAFADLSPLLALKELRLCGISPNSMQAPPDFSAMHNLTKLDLTCLRMEQLPALESVAQLEALTIRDCSNVGVGVVDSITSLKRLKVLVLDNLPAPTSMPDFSVQLPSLASLRVERCESLESLELKGSTTLKELMFTDCKSLSKVHLGPFASFPSLRRFSITRCPLLKHWVDSLKPKPSTLKFDWQQC